MDKNLKQYFIDSKARKAMIQWGDEKFPFLVLPLNEGNPDRFKTHLLYDEEFPTVLLIAKDKLRGLTIIGHKELLNNHNDLSSVAKENYLKIIAELDKEGIEYETNEESINL